MNLQAFLTFGLTVTHECERERFSLFRQLYIMIIIKDSQNLTQNFLQTVHGFSELHGHPLYVTVQKGTIRSHWGEKKN